MKSLDSVCLSSNPDPLIITSCVNLKKLSIIQKYKNEIQI